MGWHKKVCVGRKSLLLFVTCVLHTYTPLPFIHGLYADPTFLLFVTCPFHTTTSLPFFLKIWVPMLALHFYYLSLPISIHTHHQSFKPGPIRWPNFSYLSLFSHHHTSTTFTTHLIFCTTFCRQTWVHSIALYLHYSSPHF